MYQQCVFNKCFTILQYSIQDNHSMPSQKTIRYSPLWGSISLHIFGSYDPDDKRRQFDDSTITRGRQQVDKSESSYSFSKFYLTIFFLFQFISIVSTMADLAKFKSQRGQLKSKLTRTRTFYDSLDISEIDDAINAELVLRLEKTEPIFDEFNHVQSEIEFLANSEAEEKERDEFEKSYFQLIANIRKTIHTFSMSSLNTQNSINITSPSPPGDQAIRLPTIKLPTFNGHYDQWLEFRDAFNAIIQENKTISDIQKFYYLRSSLEGDACKIIQSIKASEANYVIAWQLLKDRFENKRLIVHNHVKAIFDLPVIQKESHTELRNLFDNVTKHLRSLKALGEPTEHWDTLIVHIITNKLDSITRREWESYETKNELPQMEDINKFLKHRCELLEKLEFNKTDNQGKVKNRNYSNAYLNTNNNGNNVVKLSCYFCKKPHTIYNCDIFLKYSPSARINEAKKHNLCINCLKPDHIAQQCNSSKCRKCGRKHNTMLHIEYNVSGNETSARSSSSTSGVSANVPIQAPRPPKGRTAELPSWATLDKRSQVAVP